MRKRMYKKEVFVAAEMINKGLTREKIIEQLAIARKHAEEGYVKIAHQASAIIREKYGLNHPIIN